MNTDIAELAGGLSEAQKRWLTEAFYGRGGWRIVGARKKACELGICHPGTSLITPLGMALRNHLNKGEPHAD